MKSTARKSRNNSNEPSNFSYLNDDEFLELVNFVEQRGPKRQAQLTPTDLELLIQAIRRELALSFWQCAALSLFVFILGVFVTLLILLLQK